MARSVQHQCPTCEGFGMIPVSPEQFAWNECGDCGGNGFYVEVIGQSRRKSLVETVTSTAIGFVVSLILTAIVMPAFGYPTTWAHDFWITAIFTVASVLRGYCVRRAFEGLR